MFSCMYDDVDVFFFLWLCVHCLLLILIETLDKICSCICYDALQIDNAFLVYACEYVFVYVQGVSFVSYGQTKFRRISTIIFVLSQCCGLLTSSSSVHNQIYSKHLFKKREYYFYNRFISSFFFCGLF